MDEMEFSTFLSMNGTPLKCGIFGLDWLISCVVSKDAITTDIHCAGTMEVIINDNLHVKMQSR